MIPAIFDIFIIAASVNISTPGFRPYKPCLYKSKSTYQNKYCTISIAGSWEENCFKIYSISPWRAFYLRNNFICTKNLNPLPSNTIPTWHVLFF
jgi:hypothetical protein